MKYLTIGSLLKNEEEYMYDFVKYHRYIGVDHFVFFDRNYEKMHNMFKNDSDVEIIHFPEVPGNIHQEAWGQLIKYNQGKTKWLALIDADQALVPVKNDNIKDILKEYEEFACLQVNWKTFGSSFYENKLPGSIYERFLLTCENNEIYNMHTQFICQPDRTLPIRTEEPHYPFLPIGEISVNTNKEEILENKCIALNPNRPRIWNDPPLHDVLWVAHYTNKSKEEFIIKNSKGRADIHGLKMPLNQFYEYDSLCNKIKETRVLEIWKKCIKI
jgi:hypothetical protein